MEHEINGGSRIQIRGHNFMLGQSEHNSFSSPRKEKNIKPPTEENIVPHKQISRVNPNKGKQGGIPRRNIWELQIPKDI